MDARICSAVRFSTCAESGTAATIRLAARRVRSSWRIDLTSSIAGKRGESSLAALSSRRELCRRAPSTGRQTRSIDFDSGRQSRPRRLPPGTTRRCLHIDGADGEDVQLQLPSRHGRVRFPWLTLRYLPVLSRSALTWRAVLYRVRARMCATLPEPLPSLPSPGNTPTGPTLWPEGEW